MPLRKLLSSVFDGNALPSSAGNKMLHDQPQKSGDAKRMEKAEIMALFRHDLSATPTLHKTRQKHEPEARR